MTRRTYGTGAVKADSNHFNTKTEQIPRWLTLKQAMEITGFSKSYLMTAMHYTLDLDFHLPYHQYKPGSPYRIKYQDLIDWMERHTR